MNPIKRLFGMAPTPDETGRGYIPSPLGRTFGVAKKSDYEPVDFAGRTYDGDKKILVLCTEERYLVAVCHGPAAMLAATVGHDGPHPYAGYDMAAFPDSFDERSPSMGYLPGDLPWLQCERLEAQGIRIVNDKVNGTTHIDRPGPHRGEQGRRPIADRRAAHGGRQRRPIG